MKSVYAVLFMVLFVLNSAPGQNEFEPGVILIQVRQPELVSITGTRTENASIELVAVLRTRGLKSSRKLSHVNYQTDGWYRLEFPIDLPIESIRKGLLKCPDVRYATPNYYGTISGTPYDPRWNDQWALQLIKMSEAWDIIKPNSSLLVGVMDSGIDYNHPELSPNMWSGIGEDYVDGEDPQEGPGQTHGTRVSGVIAANP